MYNTFQLALKFFHYQFTAFNSKGHGMHSPFVFDFITKVMNDKMKYPAYLQVEKLRNKLLHDPSVLKVDDLGAGTASGQSSRRSIASIARQAAKPPKYGQLLYRMLNYYQPSVIVELGTSLGITTAYLSLARPDAMLITLEGAPLVAETALRNFESLGLNNITLEQGNFDQTLLPVLSRLGRVDFVFADGNHRREPTERYFDQILPLTHNDTILVFDDIHWSAEMEQAWEAIKRHPSVRCSIDLFFIGIVLFRQEFREKQHFSIRF